MSEEKQMDEQAEYALIDAAKRGDQQAQEMLLSAFMPFIRMLARRMHAPTLMEELVQAGSEGLLRAAMHYDKRAGARLMTYAMSWILGEMKRTLRTLIWQAPMLSIDASPEEDEGSCLAQTLGQEMIDISSLDLRFAMEKIDVDERTLLLLRYFRDKTQMETAVLLGKSQSQISKLESRALGKLRMLLDSTT